MCTVVIDEVADLHCLLLLRLETELFVPLFDALGDE